MSLLATTAATAIAVASAAAAVGSFFAYLYFAHRSEAHAARDEALALAETRREVIADLRRQLTALERQLSKTATDYDERIRLLEMAVERAEAEARENVQRVHRFYAAAFYDLLLGVQADLEQGLPRLEKALARIREVLEGERPAA